MERLRTAVTGLWRSLTGRATGGPSDVARAVLGDAQAKLDTARAALHGMVER